jgi:hypothetical protein
MAGKIEVAGTAPPEDFPGVGIPCIYVDGVLSAAFSPANAKFYCYRIDSHPYGKADNASITVAQIVMPIEAFAASTQFFVQRLIAMQQQPALRKEALTAIKQLCEQALSRA